jgi:hypothetical protein
MKTDTCSCMQFNGMHLVFVLENIKVWLKLQNESWMKFKESVS